MLSSFNATVIGSKGMGGEDEGETKGEEKEEKDEEEKQDKQGVQEE